MRYLMNCMQPGAKSLLTGMATRQRTCAMPRRGWKRLAARFRNASSEQADARERENVLRDGFVRTVVLVLSATVLVLVLERIVMAEPTFDHERLDVYRLSIDYVAFSYQIAKG
jgi:hypothetical protein